MMKRSTAQNKTDSEVCGGCLSKYGREVFKELCCVPCFLRVLHVCLCSLPASAVLM